MKTRCALLAVSCVTVFVGLPTTTPPIAWRSMHAAGAPSAKPLGVTGEIAEYVAAETLGLTLVPARTVGYDALRGTIVLRISNAIIRVKKGVDRIVEYIPAGEAEKQPSRRSRLIIHPSAPPEYRDGRWPRCP